MHIERNWLEIAFRFYTQINAIGVLYHFSWSVSCVIYLSVQFITVTSYNSLWLEILKAANKVLSVHFYLLAQSNYFEPQNFHNTERASLTLVSILIEESQVRIDRCTLQCRESTHRFVCMRMTRVTIVHRPVMRSSIVSQYYLYLGSKQRREKKWNKSRDKMLNKRSAPSPPLPLPPVTWSSY